eukprot:IDg15930t1
MKRADSVALVSALKWDCVSANSSCVGFSNVCISDAALSARSVHVLGYRASKRLSRPPTRLRMRITDILYRVNIRVAVMDGCRDMRSRNAFPSHSASSILLSGVRRVRFSSATKCAMRRFRSAIIDAPASIAVSSLSTLIGTLAMRPPMRASFRRLLC